MSILAPEKLKALLRLIVELDPRGTAFENGSPLYGHGTQDVTAFFETVNGKRSYRGMAFMYADENFLINERCEVFLVVEDGVELSAITDSQLIDILASFLRGRLLWTKRQNAILGSR